MRIHQHVMLFIFWISLLLYVCHLLTNSKKDAEDTYTTTQVNFACSDLDAFKDKEALFGMYDIPSIFTPYQ